MSKISTTHSTKLQDTNGSSRGLNTASMPADRAQANHEVGKVPKPISESLRDAPARKLGKALSRMSSRQKRVSNQASRSRKQQTARHHSVHWWLSQYQSLSSKVQLPSMKTVQPTHSTSNLTMEVDGSSHPCPPLDCIKRWQSDHTCYHPHRFNELAPKSEKWNRKPRLECVNSWHPPLKTLWIYCPGHARVKGNDSRKTVEQNNPHKWLASWKI